jgi:hypothetical protein
MSILPYTILCQLSTLSIMSVCFLEGYPPYITLVFVFRVAFQQDLTLKTLTPGRD